MKKGSGHSKIVQLILGRARTQEINYKHASKLNAAINVSPNGYGQQQRHSEPSYKLMQITIRPGASTTAMRMIVVVMARVEIVMVRVMIEGMMAMVVVLEIVLVVLVAVLMVVIGVVVVVVVVGTMLNRMFKYIYTCISF